MPDESARVCLCSGADGLVVQVQLTCSVRSGDNQFRESALSYLPGAIDYHDAGIRQRLSGHPLSVPRKEAHSSFHRATLAQRTSTHGPSAETIVGHLPVDMWAICRYFGRRSAGYLMGVRPILRCNEQVNPEPAAVGPPCRDPCTGREGHIGKCFTEKLAVFVLQCEGCVDRSHIRQRSACLPAVSGEITPWVVLRLVEGVRCVCRIQPVESLQDSRLPRFVLADETSDVLFDCHVLSISKIPEESDIYGEVPLSCSRWWSRSPRTHSNCPPGASWYRR